MKTNIYDEIFDKLKENSIFFIFRENLDKKI
jgi:hypothetical protein